VPLPSVTVRSNEKVKVAQVADGATVVAETTAETGGGFLGLSIAALVGVGANLAGVVDLGIAANNSDTRGGRRRPSVPELRVRLK
jgi:hypothetical protein